MPAKDLGLKAKVDNDGDVEFVVDEAEQLFARVAEGDWPLVRFFGQWQLAEPVSPDRNERLHRCNDMTLQLNLVKVASSRRAWSSRPSTSRR